MSKYTEYSQYQLFFESFGAMVAAELAGITRAHMTKLAKDKGWKTPSSPEARKTLVQLLVSRDVQNELKNQRNIK